MRLDEPIRELLPPGTVAKPNGPEITLLDLITHHSGLPRMPDNFHPADMANPYADYTLRDLYAYIAHMGSAGRRIRLSSTATLGLLSWVRRWLIGRALRTQPCWRRKSPDPWGCTTR